MSIWPYIAIWPLLLLAAGVSGIWNWKAAASFAICVIFVRLILALGLPNPTVFVMITYSCMAVFVVYFVDRIAGFFLAAVSVFLVAYFFGLISHRAEMILSEIAVVLGMIISAAAGPSGGHWDSDRIAGNFDRRYSYIRVGLAVREKWFPETLAQNNGTRTQKIE